MTDDDIDVRFEPEHDAPTFRGERPMLTWSAYPPHGSGWMLWHLDSNDGVDSHFIGGDLTEVDSAVASARRWLNRIGRDV